MISTLKNILQPVQKELLPLFTNDNARQGENLAPLQGCAKIQFVQVPLQVNEFMRVSIRVAKLITETLTH